MNQGVISGRITWNDQEYIEIFDRKLKYLYGIIDDLFVPYGDWVQYYVADAPQNHPKHCLYIANNITTMEDQKSQAPTTDVFRTTTMNVYEYNKVDFFQYDDSIERLTHKSTIKCNVHQNYINDYYGDIVVPSFARNRLLQYGIKNLDVIMKLTPSTEYTNGPHWEVVHYVHQGKNYSINGFLSILGHVRRGPGGQVKDRSQVTVVPDGLRLINPISQFTSTGTNKTSVGFGVPAKTGFGAAVTTEKETWKPENKTSNSKMNGWQIDDDDEDWGEKPQAKLADPPKTSADNNRGLSYRGASGGSGLSRFSTRFS